MFEKCNKCTFLLKNLQSLSYECTGIPDFDTQTHPLIEMLTHLKSLLMRKSIDEIVKWLES